MRIAAKLGLFAGGVLFGTAGIRILSSRDAKKVYTHATAAVLRAKEDVMTTVTTLRENCGDILADAKAINEERAAAACEEIADTAEETGSETFQNGLCMLEYDMLYGKHYATGGEMAVQPMELHFGVDEITLTGVSSSDGGLTVHGTNFTPYSVILVDGEQVPTEYIDEQTLAAADTLLSPGEVLAVAQVSATDTLKILSQTPDWIVPAEES